MKKYTEYYIAYMDFLGFKDISKSKEWKCNDIYSLLNKANSKKFGSQKINRMIEEAYKSVKSYIMSDSIVYYVEIERPNALLGLLYSCSLLLKMLSLNDDPVFIRGAITKGMLFVEKNFIFGPALTNAYILENELAIYPRIIINEGMVNSIIKKTSEDQQKYKLFNLFRRFIIKDNDDWLCVKNFLYYSKKKLINNYYQFVCENTNVDLNKGIRDKHLYVKKQIEKETNVKSVNSF